MKLPVVSLDGKELREIEVADEVFGREVSTGAIYHAIRNELANRRVGTARTKTRAEVNRSGKKPWRQKGTGRARAGSRRSPLWKGGGTIFGPKPRDYSYRMPRKLKRAAMMSLLSQKVADGALTVVEDFAVESGKTRDLYAKLRPLAAGEKASERTILILDGTEEGMVRRAGRNLPWLQVLSYDTLAAHPLFYGRKVVIPESAARQLSDFYTGKVRGRGANGGDE